MSAREILDRARRPLVMITLIAVISVVVFVTLAKSEWAGYADIALLRHERAQAAKSFEIAAVWGKGDPSLTAGAGVAADEVNAAGGARKATIEITSFQVTPGAETKRAREIARDTRFAAVIGHTTSDIANLAAISYEQTNLLYIAVNATDPSLTIHDGFDFIFRNGPTDNAISDVEAKVLRAVETSQSGRIGVLYTRSKHYMMTSYLDDLDAALGETLAPSFEKPYALALEPLDPLARIRAQDELRNTVSRMYDDPQPLDAVVLLDDSSANAAMAINRLVSTMPANETIIVGGPGIDPGDRPLATTPCYDVDQLAQNGVALRKAGNVFIVTTFCSSTPQAMSKLAAFEAKFKALGPSKNVRLSYFVAWQGYRAVKILAQALAHADSKAPIDVVAQLHSRMRFDDGTSFARNGDLAMFTPEGDLPPLKLYVKVLSRKKR